MNKKTPDTLPWQATASLEALQVRAKLLATLRQYFAINNVLEVETPILSRAANPDPNIESFLTTTQPPYYLRTSPEYPLKRLLAAAYGDCYELGKVFRQGESGQHHNPEFSLLEWYRLDWNWRRLAKEVIDLIQYCGITINQIQVQNWPVEFLSYTEVFVKYCQFNPATATERDFILLAKRHHINAPKNLNPDQWLDLFMSLVIQPALAPKGITIIHDFPASQAALAMLNPENPQTALRFEVYLGQQELANGYQELRDSKELERRFLQDNQKRLKQGMQALPLDQQLLAAQRKGLPACSGVALGVDRLLMSLCGHSHISQSIAFPDARA